MKIAIDCRALRKPPSGISNFLVTSINQFATLKPKWKFYLLTNDKFHPEHKKNLILSDNIIVLEQPLFIFKKIALIWIFFKVPFILLKVKPNLYWSPAFILPPFLPASIKTLVTVHDMVFKKYKNTMSLAGRLYSNLLFDFSIRKASFLWANSDYTKNEIIKFYTKRQSKEIFSGFFVDTSLYKPIIVSPPAISQILKKYNLNEKFILFVGTIEPRKNLSFLLSLTPELSRKGYSILIVGIKGWGKSGINIKENDSLHQINNVSFSGFVTSEELVKIYNIASVYVSTSLNEGFGMPQLEAMACGCPVVSPHNSAMIEVVHGAGETVYTWEPEEWITKIEQVAQNRGYYQKLGLERVAFYNKEKVISNLLNFLKVSCLLLFTYNLGL